MDGEEISRESFLGKTLAMLKPADPLMS